LLQNCNGPDNLKLPSQCWREVGQFCRSCVRVAGAAALHQLLCARWSQKANGLRP